MRLHYSHADITTLVGFLGRDWRLFLHYRRNRDQFLMCTDGAKVQQNSKNLVPDDLFQKMLVVLLTSESSWRVHVKGKKKAMHGFPKICSKINRSLIPFLSLKFK